MATTSIKPLASSNTEPKIIGGYEILSLLGKGGMGTVYKARQVDLDRIVALKVLPRKVANDEKFILRFQREARASARLNHPNIVQGIDVGQDPKTGCWYFAMEYIDGPTLKQLLKELKMIPEKRALLILRNMAAALECGWENGIVHRDIKPDNILLTGRGEAKLADLGLAKHIQEDHGLTTDGMALGTPHYMSPEQARGDEDGLDIRSDLYSLGATMYHLVTGQTPFSGKTSALIMTKHLTESCVPAHLMTHQISEELGLLIQSLMEKKRKDRVQTPTELSAEVRKLLERYEPENKKVTHEPPGSVNSVRSARSQQTAEANNSQVGLRTSKGRTATGRRSLKISTVRGRSKAGRTGGARTNLSTRSPRGASKGSRNSQTANLTQKRKTVEFKEPVKKPWYKSVFIDLCIVILVCGAVYAGILVLRDQGILRFGAQDMVDSDTPASYKKEISEEEKQRKHEEDLQESLRSNQRLNSNRLLAEAENFSWEKPDDPQRVIANFNLVIKNYPETRAAETARNLAHPFKASLEVKAFEVFQRYRSRLDDLILKKDWDQAEKVWEDFPPALKTDHVTENILKAHRHLSEAMPPIEQRLSAKAAAFLAKKPDDLSQSEVDGLNNILKRIRENLQQRSLKNLSRKRLLDLEKTVAFQIKKNFLTKKRPAYKLSDKQWAGFVQRLKENNETKMRKYLALLKPSVADSELAWLKMDYQLYSEFLRHVQGNLKDQKNNSVTKFQLLAKKNEANDQIAYHQAAIATYLWCGIKDASKAIRDGLEKKAQLTPYAHHVSNQIDQHNRIAREKAAVLWLNKFDLALKEGNIAAAEEELHRLTTKVGQTDIVKAQLPALQKRLQAAKQKLADVVGLVGHWKLDEGEGLKINDASGYASTGTIKGKKGSAAWMPGAGDLLFGNKGSLLLNGNEGHVEISHQRHLSPQGTKGQLTLSAWIKLRKYPPNPKSYEPRAPIIEKGNSGQWEYALYVYKTGEASMCVWKLNGKMIAEAKGGKIPLNTWTHVCGIYTDRMVQVYINGELIQSVEHLGDAANGKAPLLLGARTDGNQYMNAQLDDVRIFNRALNPETIKLLASGKNP